MRLYLIILYSLISAFFVSGSDKPNIIFILVDDMGYSDIGCYGGEVATPHLDSLAENGLRFTQMHNTSKCFPTRACLLTGLYAQQNGMHAKYKRFTNSVTLGEVLKGAGYRTLASGKHHSQESLFDRGFDRYFGLLDGATNHFNPGVQREGEVDPARKTINGRGWAIDDKTLRPYTPPEKDFYSTDSYTDYALDYLEEYKGEDKPFFLYLSYTAPHDPLHAWPEDIAKYLDTYEVGYETIRSARYEKMKRLGLVDELSPLSEATHGKWDSLSDRQRKIEVRKMAVYAAMIDRVDQNIGRLIAKLKELGEFENTMIMFASDNGSSAENAEKQGNKETPRVEDGNDIELIGTMGYWASLLEDWANVSNTPFRRYKVNSYQGGLCTPFVVHWPAGIEAKPGSINSTFTGHFIDVMPTLLEITGAEYPSEHRGEHVFPMAGESFLSQLKGEESQRSSPLFWQWKKTKAVRHEKWKALDNGKGWELYDMSQDLTETVNLAEQYPEKLTQLIGMHEAWYASTPAGKE
ncbi:arylsulfatase [Pelagicoccus mobilis]|uniref:Arylsulfatase n=1 Tax=Pelagicoccus mobilis TaxID=415221 RepID=A0A934S0L1_9BACT|nr:arylsulfatase [Pelagicoccus mobilis]MBK1879718.1 arylsulfatase [Pelagicoccus mobilis]